MSEPVEDCDAEMDRLVVLAAKAEAERDRYKGALEFMYAFAQGVAHLSEHPHEGTFAACPFSPCRELRAEYEKTLEPKEAE